jgi:hypothetical protein
VTLPPPLPDFQLDFLRKIQLILADGSFVASYKYALLHALADLSVTHGDDSGRELRLGTKDISEQLIELYWRQAIPYSAPNADGSVVLRQNMGRQAAIIAQIQKAQNQSGHSLQRARRTEAWPRLVAQVERVLKVMPLWKLQTVGRDRLDFLYENWDSGDHIVIKPGVQYCFRAFYRLITDLVRGAWLRFVRANNVEVLGASTDLSSFLFGSTRVDLARVVPVLLEYQEGDCLYCRKTLRREVHVDHFVPWARYPHDLAHNLVLAHASCNLSKSDHLADEQHLMRWIRRNEERELSLMIEETGVICDQKSTLAVARWAYSQTAAIGGLVWSTGRELKPLASNWEPWF